MWANWRLTSIVVNKDSSNTRLCLMANTDIGVKSLLLPDINIVTFTCNIRSPVGTFIQVYTR